MAASELDRQAEALGRVESFSSDSEDEDGISEEDLSESCRQELQRIQKRMEQEGYPNGYHWQSTATSDSMYKVLASELRRANHFDTLLALTLAFKEETGLYCFNDTESPEEAQKLLTRLGKLWQNTLRVGMPLDARNREGVVLVLQRLQSDLREMHYQYEFNYESSQPLASPAKKRKQLSALPAHLKPLKKRRDRSVTPDKKPQKKPKKSKKNSGTPSAGTASGGIRPLFADSPLMERVRAKLAADDLKGSVDAVPTGTRRAN